MKYNTFIPYKKDQRKTASPEKLASHTLQLISFIFCLAFLAGGIIAIHFYNSK